MPKLWIVPDSNTLYADLTLEGSVAAKLRDWCNVLDARIKVPCVVKDEMVGKYKREVAEKARNAVALREKLATFGISLPDSWASTVVEACQTSADAFDQDAVNRTLRQLAGS